MSVVRSLSAALLTSTAIAAPGAVAAAEGPPSAEPQRVIVALDGDVTAAFLGQLDDLGVTRGLELPTIDAVAVTAPPAVIEAVAALPGVVAVQPQRALELHLYASKEQIGAVGVDEPARYEADGLVFERPGVTGAGVTVGVIDSGIFADHPGFGDRVVAGLNFEFSELRDTGAIPAEDWDAYAEATGPTALQDEVGHGTHVAGVVGGDGSGTQTDRDLAGVAPEVEFVSLKIASAANGVIEDVGFEENALAAIDYVIRHPELGIRLTNNSWGLLETEPGTGGVGEPTDFDAARAMVEAASDAGITMVFSAGNDGPEAGSIGEDPGGTPAAITVAAACKALDGSCPEGEITGFSSRGAEDGTGPQVDVTAPGDNILAPVSPSILAPLSGCPDPGEPLYYCLSGTSMAAPHVAGVVALMQELHPELSPAEAEHCLTTTAVDMLDPGVDIHSGHGMVDTPAALECVHQLAGAEPVDVTEEVPAGAGEVSGGPAEETGGSLPATGSGLVLLGLASLGLTALLHRRGR